MKKNDSVKRLIILALGLIGLCVLTAFYAHDWFAYYYHHIAWKTHNRFNVNGHLLIVALYFILLFFFSNTYGALKIGSNSTILPGVTIGDGAIVAVFSCLSCFLFCASM